VRAILPVLLVITFFSFRPEFPAAGGVVAFPRPPPMNMALIRLRRTLRRALFTNVASQFWRPPLHRRDPVAEIVERTGRGCRFLLVEELPMQCWKSAGPELPVSAGVLGAASPFAAGVVVGFVLGGGVWGGGVVVVGGWVGGGVVGGFVCGPPTQFVYFAGDLHASLIWRASRPASGRWPKEEPLRSARPVLGAASFPMN